MLGQLFARATAPQEQRALQVTPWGPWDSSHGASSTGINVTQDSSLSLLTVFGCVTLISDTIATLPRDVFRKRSDGTNEEVAPKPAWLEQPNPRTDIIEFLTQSLSSLLLDGNCYWAYATDYNLTPTEIHVLDPKEVVPRMERNELVYYVKGDRFRGRLLHIKGLTRPGQLKGLSPVESARQSIGLGLAQQDWQGSFYSGGVTTSGVVTTPGPLTQDQARDLKTNIGREHGGLAKAHLPMVLTNGATWTSISVTPEQAQFLESRNFQAAEIAAQMFLLDPSMLGIASAGTRGQNLTYANLEQRGIHLVQFTLLRWIIRLERAFSTLLPKPQFFKFNVNALERADMKTRYEANAIALGNKPFKTVNEVREKEDDPPLPGGDSITPAATAAPFAPPAPNGDQPVGATK